MRYVLHDMIGRGGMGAVYKATDRLTGQVVALKKVTTSLKSLVLNTQDISVSPDQMSLAHEFQTLASLRHPNIISVLDYGFDEGGKPFFTMDYLHDATNIVEAAAERSIEERIQLIVQVLQALAYLHRNGVIHRDLKPGNIMVDGRVRVLDFGISMQVSHAKSSMAGTVLYLAPELFTDQPASFASDLYAIGVILYELLTGRHPFRETGESITNLVNAVQSERADLDAVSLTDLSNILGKMLEKDPRDRYHDASAVIRDLCKATGIAVPEETDIIRESYLQAARFVGRDEELARLQQGLDDLQGNRGSFWLIGGESGVGKSRLLNELRTHALIMGVDVVVGQSVESGGRAYQLWQDIIPHLLLRVEIDDFEAGVLKELVPNIGAILGREIPDAPEVRGDVQQARLMNTIKQIIQRIETPALIILEDLQWSRESLNVLQNLSIDRLPLLMVGTYRNDERPDLPQLLSSAATLTLERLSDAQIAELSEAILGEQGHHPQVVDLLTNETEGNTFFMVEVIRALAEEAGGLDHIGFRTLPRGVFTGGMQRLVQRRLDKIRPENRPLLNLAAVAGRQIDINLLTHLAPHTNIETWLSYGQQAAVLSVIDGRWQFAHDKLRESVLDILNDKPDLHRHVAEAIEAVYDPQDYIETLMNHWREAGDTAREVIYLDQYIDRVVDYGVDFNGAIDLLQRAIDLDGATPWRIFRMAAVHQRLGKFDIAEDYYKRALAHEDMTPTEEMRVRNSLAFMLVMTGRYDEALAEANAVISMARPDDYEKLGSAYNIIAMCHHHRGDFDTAHGYYELTLENYRKDGDRRLIAGALSNYAVLHLYADDYEPAYDLLMESLELRRAIGDQLGMSQSNMNLALVVDNMGDLDRAYDYHMEGLAIARTIGWSGGIGVFLTNLAINQTRRGKLDEAIDIVEEALAMRRAMNDTPGVAIVLNVRSKTLFEKGRYQEALASAAEGLDTARQVNNPRLIAQAIQLCVQNSLVLGEPYKHLLAEGLALPDNQSIQLTVLPTMLLYLVALEEFEMAATLLGTLANYNLGYIERDWVALYQPQIEERLGKHVFETAWQAGLQRELSDMAQMVKERYF
ncbi:MAG: tetratricopeptide repeat protein [Chloroflexi bacterium]|nr:tetratricopeptide repeat protein [Chloroflexota bacterium]